MPERQNPRQLAVRESGMSPDVAALFTPEVAKPSGLAPQGKFLVILVRPGLGANSFNVPQGTTVGDLLEKAKANSDGQDVMIGKEKVTSERVLKPREAIFMVPRPKNA